MKNIYALQYKITKILLFISTFLLTFAILQDFSDIAIIIIGLFVIIIGVVHGAVCDKYERLKNHIKILESIESFTEFLENLTEKIEMENNDEKKS